MNVYPLLHTGNRKPVDIGCGRLTASIDSSGRFMAINGYHSRQGYITCSSLPPFPNDRWHDSGYVRSYRKWIAGEAGDARNKPEGFGVIPVGRTFDLRHYVNESGHFGIRYVSNQLSIYSLYQAIDIRGMPFIVQRVYAHNLTADVQEVRFEVGGTMLLKRCAYGQLTERGPIPMPAATNRFDAEGNAIRVLNAHLPACMKMFAFEEECPIMFTPFSKVCDHPLVYSHSQSVWVNVGEWRRLTFVYAMSEEINEMSDPDTVLEAAEVGIDADAAFIGRMGKKRPAPDAMMEEQTFKEFIVRQNLRYITSCCAVPTIGEACCIITDHQLLPLSWNRDAYYMMKLVMEASKHRIVVSEIEQDVMKQMVRGHLLWMFEQAQRPHGYWGRAYLTNGHCKDQVFQLDQQCYPLLELVEYFDWTGDEDTVNRVLPIASSIVDVILQHRHAEKWVFFTEETPGDDEVAYPFHFSSQVLAWHMFRRLQELNERFRFSDHNFSEWADRIRDACLQLFTTTHKGKPLFSYATDLEGNFAIYHDANDLPTVLAPFWGLCRVNDRTWKHTMALAFTADNKGGFYKGAFCGLGSVHTPHPWPLGDAQELLFRAAIQDTVGRDKVLAKLLRVVQWDGLFSEAIHEDTGKVASRHWFSWPGTFFSLVLLMTGEM